MEISVVSPIFNSESTLPELPARLEAAIRGACSDFELILVNDGSRDRSWEVIKKLARENPRVRGIDLMRNYGQQGATLRGILSARHDVIVTMDDDLQFPPEEIPKLIDKLADGFDVVYGTPRRRRDNIWRRLTSRVLRLAMRGSLGVETAAAISSFRAMRREVRQAFALCRGPFLPIDVPLSWATTKFAAVEVEHQPRASSKSNYTFRSLLALALNALTGFSVLPLKLASVTGFIFTLFGGGILAYVVGRRLLLGYSMPGFPFLASVIAIFSGAQLFALGIFGEYLARMYFRDIGMPAELVRETVGFPAKE